MKKNSIKLLLLSVMIMVNMSVKAYDFEVNGFYYNITSLQDLTVELTNGDVLYTGDVVVPESVTYFNRTFAVTRLGDYVFQDCSDITSIEIPNSITTTGAYTFSGCYKITTLRIPSSITEIGNSSASSNYGRYCFSGCTNLENLIFEGGNSSEIILHPNSWTSGSSRTFVDCRLKTLYIGRNIECLHRGYADYCNPFYNQTSLKEIRFGQDVNIIISRMFQGCSSLEYVDIPGNITSIEANAFLDCTMLSDIQFNEGLNTIGPDAFKNCKSLKKIILPSSIADIGNEAFLNCTRITQVFSKSSTPCNLAESAFAGATYLNATLYVPVGAKTLYEAATGWKDFTSIVEIDDFENVVNSYNANITVSNGGRLVCNGVSITNTNLAMTIKAGEDFNLEAIPNEGCRLVSLIVDGNDVTNIMNDGKYVIKDVAADVVISAVFEEIPITLAIQYDKDHVVKQQIERGKCVKFSLKPAGSRNISAVFLRSLNIPLRPYYIIQLLLLNTMTI